MIGSYSVKLTTKNRALAAAVAAPLTLIFFGVLTWIALVFSFALVLPVAHMALRPRSLSARYNAASDEVRALFSAAPAASHEEDAEAGVVRDVPVRARAAGRRGEQGISTLHISRLRRENFARLLLLAPFAPVLVHGLDGHGSRDATALVALAGLREMAVRGLFRCLLRHDDVGQALVVRVEEVGVCSILSL